MQHILNTEKKFFAIRRPLVVFMALTVFVILAMWSPGLWAAQERSPRKAAPAQSTGTVAAPSKSLLINDANINSALKRADDMMKKGEVDGPLKILTGVYDYSKDVLLTVKFFQGHYEKIVNDPTTSQSEKEEIYIKLKRMNQLLPKYNTIREVTTYNVGYLYAKKGDTEKARKFLTEVLELTPFSTKKDSISMKAKTLLLDIYGLEGEF